MNARSAPVFCNLFPVMPVIEIVIQEKIMKAAAD